MFKNMTHGKWIGFWSWLIYEYLIICLTVYQILDAILWTHKLDFNIVNGVLLSQGAIFTVVFSAKASSNFTKKE
jgi:hypothetical protein